MNNQTYKHLLGKGWKDCVHVTEAIWKCLTIINNDNSNDGEVLI